MANGAQICVAVPVTLSASCTSRVVQDLCAQAHQKWQLCKVSIGHRTGRVDIEEASVVICASSAHRLAAIEACRWLIDELKACVPVWKKEFFADGSVWKENETCRYHGPRGQG